MSETNGSPWYLKAAEKFGVPFVLLGFLIWFITTHVDSDLHGLAKQSTAITATLSLHELDASYSVSELQRVRNVLTQICMNTAEDASARDRCFNPGVTR